MQNQQRTARVPVIESEWWRICEMPDLGDLAGPEPQRQHVVDHGFIQAADGTWQLWACIRGAGIGRLIYGWQGSDLEQGPWAPAGVKLRADRACGESIGPDGQEHIGAPFFFRHAGRYHCFYHTGGSIRMATSDDGIHYARTGRPDDRYELYPHGGRDVMVLEHQGLLYFFSTVSVRVADNLSYSFVNLRTTPDLQKFSDFSRVSEGGAGGNGPVSAESPFVVHLDGYWYLFRASSISFETYVYRAADPYSFGCNDDRNLIATFPIKAPELIHHNNQWYISDLYDFQGIRLAKLRWDVQ